MSDISYPVLGGMFDSTTVVDTVNGFPRGDKAVDSSFFAKMISSFYSNGVLAAVGTEGNNGLKATPSSGMTLSVSPGVAWIRGYMAWLQTEKSFALTAGHTYSIVLRLSTASGGFDLIATEEQSGLPTDTELIRDLVLAEVTIPGSATELTESMIVDTRGDRAMCGFVTCTVDALQTVPFATDAGSVGGVPETAFMRKSGGTMTGKLTAAPERTGVSAVRNIAYGTTLPDVLNEGEIFILLSE